MAGEPFTNVGKTLGTLESRLRLELGNRSDITPELLREWINDSYIDLANTLHLPSMQDSMEFLTVADEESYDLPAGVGTIHRAAWRDTATDDGGKLVKTDADEYRMLSFTVGRPERVFRLASVLVLWPTPDAAYRIVLDYTVKVQILTEPYHSPILDVQFHEPMFYGAKARGLEAIKDFAGAAVATNTMTRLMRRKLDLEAEEDDGKSAQLIPVRRKSQLTVRRGLSTRRED